MHVMSTIHPFAEEWERGIAMDKVEYIDISQIMQVLPIIVGLYRLLAYHLKF